jgi:hypothetical protein
MSVFKGALGGRRRMSIMPKEQLMSNSLLNEDWKSATPNNCSEKADNESLDMSLTQPATSPCAGLRVENITPCFISKHVKKLCDAGCWETWEEAVKELAVSPLQTVEDIFAEKMKDYMSKVMKPSRHEQFAAVVMADVSGYSKLSSSLAGRGAEGAEILCRTMKGYLDKVNNNCAYFM